MNEDEIVIRRCPSCGQPYDTEIYVDGCCIQPEKCSRCKTKLPLLTNATPRLIAETKRSYYICGKDDKSN